MNNKKPLTLSQMQTIEIDILREFSKFCKLNNISFYLSNGTLLGAVKYKGFVPWDDDIDVFVPRADYDRLIKCYKDSDRFVLFHRKRVKKFNYPYAKLCDMTTEKIEDKTYAGVSTGLEIDIFPLDVFSASPEKAKAQISENLKIKQKLGYVKLKKYEPDKNRSKTEVLIRKCMIKFLHMLGSDFFCNKMEKVATRYNNTSKPEYLGCAIWPVYGEKEIISAQVFSEKVEVEFAGEKYPAPKEYDNYLRSLYGDYEKDPPIEKQVTHHRFLAYTR